MALVNGYFQLSASPSPSRVKVAWRSAAGQLVPDPPEERPLQYNGNEVEPSVIIEAFDVANTDAELEAIGEALWQCLAGGAAGAEWQKASAAVDLRTGLDLTDANEHWQALPWEAAWDDGFLTLIPENPFVRVGRQSIKSLAAGWPRRILVVCGEEEGSAISVREELEAIEDGLWERRREIILRVADRPTETQLYDAIDKFSPHVLHFIGHGDGTALIINSTPAQWRLKASHINTWLNKGKKPAPQLVFLNACRSQVGNQTEQMTLRSCRSLTNVFLTNGVPAVIGMAGDIEGQAALVLARRFYQKWLSGEPLDSAFTAARLETQQSQGAKPRQHLLACLTVACESKDWMSWPPIEPHVTAALQAARLGDLHRTFVDRNDLRLQIFDTWLHVQNEWREEPKAPGIIVVRGDEKSGKTDAVRLVLKAMHAKGWIARCQNMDSPSMNWMEALRTFAAGTNHCGVLSDKLPAALFAEFFARLGDPLFDANEEKDLELAFRAWRDALKAAAQDSPMVLAFDKLMSSPPVRLSNGDYVLPEYLGHLTDRLFLPLIQPPADQRVLIILIMTKQEADAYVPLIEERLKIAPYKIDVSAFTAPESKRALRQYFRNMMNLVQYQERFIPAAATRIKTIAEDWVEESLGFLAEELDAADLPGLFDEFMDRLSRMRLLKKKGS